jgi:hypothetical protein
VRDAALKSMWTPIAASSERDVSTSQASTRPRKKVGMTCQGLYMWKREKKTAVQKLADWGP